MRIYSLSNAAQPVCIHVRPGQQIAADSATAGLQLKVCLDEQAIGAGQASVGFHILQGDSSCSEQNTGHVLLVMLALTTHPHHHM